MICKAVSDSVMPYESHVRLINWSVETSRYVIDSL